VAKVKVDFQPQVVNLSLYAGDGTKFRVRVTDPTGSLVSITGGMQAQVRATHDAPDPPAAIFEVDLTQAAEGIASLLLPGNQTQALVTTDEKFEGVWDLEWTAEGAEPITLCQGAVECYPDVSR
jgi:hypothetical protein